MLESYFYFLKKASFRERLQKANLNTTNPAVQDNDIHYCFETVLPLYSIPLWDFGKKYDIYNKIDIWLGKLNLS